MIATASPPYIPAIAFSRIAFAKSPMDAQMECDAAMQQVSSKARSMFSIISLYFAYRRDVVSAERYIAALHKTKAQAVVADDVTPTPVEEQLPLAA